MSKKVLIGSGASTKIPFMGGAFQALTESNNDYDVYIGTSASAICLPFIALDKQDFLKKNIINVTLSDVFDKPLLKSYSLLGSKKLPTIWSILRVLCGGNSLTTTKKLKKLLVNNFTECDFNYLNNETNKTVYLGVVNYNTKSAMYINNRDYTYDEFIDGIIASSNIPLATEPIKIRDSWCADGGVVDHFANDLAIKLGAEHIDLVVSRPERDLNPKVTGYDIDETHENWNPDNIFDVLSRLYNIMLMNTSNDDEKILIEKCEKHNVGLKIYYAPYVLTNEVYSDLNKEINTKWWNLGYDLVKNG
jgi:NTE family protein